MKILSQSLVLFLLLGCVASAQSRDFWEKKDYRQCTEKECHKLLEDSPWAVNYSISQIFFDRVVTDTTDRTQTTESLRNSTSLIGSRGLTVPLSVYRPGAGEAHEFQFVFPHQYNGRPVLGPGDKSLAVEFNHPNIRGPAARVLIEFKVEKMTMRGAVVY